MNSFVARFYEKIPQKLCVFSSSDVGPILDDRLKDKFLFLLMNVIFGLRERIYQLKIEDF